MATIDTNGSGISLGGDGFGSNNNVLMFLIFAMMFGNGGFGGWGNGNGNSNAIQNDINRGFDSQNQMANQREILSAVTAGTAQSVAAVNQSFHDMLAYNGDKYNEITRDIGALQVAQTQALAHQNECCCNTLRAIDGVNYNGALNTAAIQKTIVEEAQKNRDLMTSNRMADLQNENNFLRTQNLLGNVVRYPTTMAYSAGTSPFCNCGNYGFAA